MDFALTLWAAAASEPSIWPWVAKVTVNVLLVIIGINLLIIVHEFGHFAVARLCGVRCDKFYIWFDFWGLKFFKFKWGDTEYGLGVFPLGGYVKMLGQEDNPGELRAEMERARQAQQDPSLLEEAKPLKFGDTVPEHEEAPPRSVEELNEAIYSPDSYLSKSVPQRMAIIVAGVVMNFLFAILCGAGAYMVGFKEAAPVIGRLLPGAPAWEAGLQIGDRIESVAGAPIRSFMDLNMAMVGAEDGVVVKLQRPGLDGTSTETIEKKIFARKRGTDLSPMLGIISSHTLEIAHPEQPDKDWIPVDRWAKDHYASETIEKLNRKNLVVGFIEETGVNTFAGYQEAQLAAYGRPVNCRLLVKAPPAKPVQIPVAPGATESPVVLSASPKVAPPEFIDVTLPAIPMKEIGVRFKPGAITMVLPGSDAEKKGIKPGDVIVSVDGDANYDPLKLPQTILRKQNEDQKSVELALRKENGEEQSVSVELAPIRSIPELSAMSMKDPLGSTALGLSWGVEPVIAAAEDESLPVGAKVVSFKFVHSISLLGGTTFTKDDKDGFLCMNIGDKIDMPYILAQLLQVAESEKLTEKQEEKGEVRKTVSVRLEIETGEGMTKMFDMPVRDSKDWFHTERGLGLDAETTTIKADDWGDAFNLGSQKMVEYSMSVYKFLRRLVSGGISPKALGGPVTIVRGAYMFVERGFGSYLLFLCLIGANLAVINLLPIPVLDGGHLVFLLYEGIFRRPPNETVQVVLSYIGLFLILSLMVWAISLDVGCVKRW